MKTSMISKARRPMSCRDMRRLVFIYIFKTKNYSQKSKNHLTGIPVYCKINLKISEINIDDYGTI